jgi:hypothetical protein
VARYWITVHEHVTSQEHKGRKYFEILSNSKLLKPLYLHLICINHTVLYNCDILREVITAVLLIIQVLLVVTLW